MPNIRHRFLRLSALAASVLFATTACGTEAGTKVKASAPVPEAVDVPSIPSIPANPPLPERVLSEVQHPKGGARMLAPPAGAVPAVSAEAAYETFRRDGLRPRGAMNARQQLVLTLYSNDVYGDTDPASGKKTLRFQNVLAWAVIFNGVEPTVRGGATKDGGRPAVNSSVRCDFVYLVDAMTGTYMMAFEDCPGKG